MIKFSVVIETKKRPGENYFQRTMDNLRRAGILESQRVALLSVSRGDDCTRQQNAARAIEMAAANDCGWVMKLEDDLDFTDYFFENVAAWLEDFGHARTPFFALGCSFEIVSHSNYRHGFPHVEEYVLKGERCVPHPVRGFWGAQALVFKRAEALDLVKWLGPDPALFDGKNYHRDRGHDLILQQWAHERGYTHVACAVPSFVQHIGEHSNLSRPEIGHVQPFFQFPFAGHNYRYGGKVNA